MTATLAMLGLGAACWVMRSLFILLVPAERLPAAVRDALQYLAPAVLAALVASELTDGAQGLALGGAVVLVGSMALAAVLVRLTGSLGLSVATGLGAAILLDVVLVRL